MQIIYLKHKQIDKKRWDSCIDRAQNGLIYVYSWYLDIFSKNWDALVYEDYSVVMPLIWNEKYGIKYIYQPIYLQQSGVFSIDKRSDSEIETFINHIPKKFRTINMNLNFMNKLSEKFNCTEKKNYELKLSKSYSELYQIFNNNTKRNIKKAVKAGFIIDHHASSEEMIALKKEMKNISVDKDIFMRFKKLIKYCKQNHCSKVYAVRNKEKKIISVAFFSFSHNRAYYIFSATSIEGKEKSAAFLSVNEFIKDYSGQNLILDFEGSMIPGIARFFKGWGATNQPYYNLMQNKLPLPFWLFKK